MSLIQVVAQSQPINVATAIAPVIVAAAVLVVQYFQNRWQRRFSERQMASDLQKFQLTSMDKRVEVIAAVTDLLANLPYNQDDGPARAGFYNSLVTGQLLFNKSIADELQAAWLLQVRYANARAVRQGIIARASEERLDEMRTELFQALEKIRTDMIASGRVVISQN